MTKVKQTFQVLEKILNENNEQMLLNNEKYQQLQSFILNVNTSTYEVMKDSSYENKSNLLMNIKLAIQEIEFLTSNPQLQNKTIVVVEGGKKAVPDWFEHNQMEEFARLTRQNANIPMILSANRETEIIVQNELDNFARITKEEYRHMNLQLYKENIGVEQLVKAFYAGAQSPFEHIVFIYLPQYMSRQSEMYQLLLQLAEVTIMIDPPIQLVKNYHPATYAKAKFIVGESSELKFTSISKQDIRELLSSLNIPIKLPTSRDLMVHRYEDYLIEVSTKIKEEKLLVKELKEDFVKVSDKELEENLQRIQGRYKKQLQLNQDSHQKVLKNLNDTLKSLEKLDQTEMIEIVHQLSNKAQLLIAKQALTAHQLDDNNTYRSAISRLKSANSVYAVILEAHTKNEITKVTNVLSSIPINEVIAYILLLNFRKFKSKPLYETLKNYFEYNHTAEIEFYLGKAASELSVKKDAEQFFRSAMNKGSYEAANMLFQYIEEDNIIELEKLANLMVPKACYLVGKYYLNSKFTKASTYLKMAATLGNEQAIKELARIEFDKYRKNQSKLEDEKLNIIFSNALQLNLYVNEKFQSKEASERIGKLYYWINDHRKAEPFLSSVDNADCNYLCGKIYQYGNVLSQDLQKSKKYFERAANQGHTKATTELHKVTGWIQSNKVRETSSSRSSYSSSSYTSSSSSSDGCFLTTATCIALGKEDNCDEIINYKKYRDKHLLFDEDGKDLITEYYRIAPIIVEKIERESNAKELYMQLYNQYIKVGYDYLQKKDLKNAKSTYIEMVKSLCSKYHIVPFE